MIRRQTHTCPHSRGRRRRLSEEWAAHQDGRFSTRVHIGHRSEVCVLRFYTLPKLTWQRAMRAVKAWTTLIGSLRLIWRPLLLPRRAALFALFSHLDAIHGLGSSMRLKYAQIRAYLLMLNLDGCGEVVVCAHPTRIGHLMCACSPFPRSPLPCAHYRVRVRAPLFTITTFSLIAASIPIQEPRNPWLTSMSAERGTSTDENQVRHLCTAVRSEEAHASWHAFDCETALEILCEATPFVQYVGLDTTTLRGNALRTLPNSVSRAPPRYYSSENGGCGKKWRRFQHVCIHILHKRGGAVEQENHCVGLGGHLISLTTLEKHEFACVLIPRLCNCSSGAFFSFQSCCCCCCRTFVWRALVTLFAHFSLD